MNGLIKPKNALISVFHKDGLEPVVKKLDEMGVAIYSTGGTQIFIEEQGVKRKQSRGFNLLPFYLRGSCKNTTPQSFWWYFRA